MTRTIHFTEVIKSGNQKERKITIRLLLDVAQRRYSIVPESGTSFTFNNGNETAYWSVVIDLMQRANTEAEAILHADKLPQVAPASTKCIRTGYEVSSRASLWAEYGANVDVRDNVLVASFDREAIARISTSANMGLFRALALMNYGETMEL